MKKILIARKSNLKKDQITVQGAIVSIKQKNKNDFISLTDIARAKNPDFKGVEFNAFKMDAGLNSFTIKKGEI